MELRADEDDMRAVTCGGEESAEEGDFFKDKVGDFFGWWNLETNDSYSSNIHRPVIPLFAFFYVRSHPPFTNLYGVGTTEH